jgi:hypothetical protein
MWGSAAISTPHLLPHDMVFGTLLVAEVPCLCRKFVSPDLEHMFDDLTLVWMLND